MFTHTFRHRESVAPTIPAFISASRIIEKMRARTAGVFERLYQPISTSGGFTHLISSRREDQQFDDGIFPRSIHTGDNLQGFQSMHEPKSPQFKEEIPAPVLSSSNRESSIDMSGLQKTSRYLTKLQITISSPLSLYDNSTGSWKANIEKGSIICVSKQQNHIYSHFDNTKQQRLAYLMVEHIVLPDGTIEVFSGMVRAPWLDARVNEEKTIHHNPEQTPKQKNCTVFSGFVGTDGRELPASLLQSVTIQYFGKVIEPKIGLQIQAIEKQIDETRRSMKQEFLTTKTPLGSTKQFPIYQTCIKKREKLQNIQYTVQSIRFHGELGEYSTSLEQVIQSLQKTPDWQKIIQGASTIRYKLRKRKLSQ